MQSVHEELNHWKDEAEKRAWTQGLNIVGRAAGSRLRRVLDRWRYAARSISWEDAVLGMRQSHAEEIDELEKSFRSIMLL